jgi:pseudouridylate synthase
MLNPSQSTLRMPKMYALSETIQHAQRAGSPIVALESTVITHGLPIPHNLELARDMEAEVRAHGATPATIALLEGKVRIGLTEAQLTALAHMEQTRKISLRDVGIALGHGLERRHNRSGHHVVCRSAGGHPRVCHRRDRRRAPRCAL